MDTFKLNDTVLSTDESSAVLEAGIPHIQLSHRDFNLWWNEMSKQMANEGSICGLYSNFTTDSILYPACTCSSVSNAPDFKIRFKRWEYQLSPEAYITLVEEQSATYCVFNVIEELEKSIAPMILGQAFMKAFTIQFNADDGYIGITSPSDTSLITDHLWIH